MRKLILLTLLFAVTSFAGGTSPSANIDTDRMTVSGVSAGGAMAQQIHIAYSDMFSGAAIIAGVPFGCADGSLGTAMARCMAKSDDTLSVTDLAEAIRSAEKEGRIAATANLTDDKAWLFHGTLDKTVGVDVTDAAKALYEQFIATDQVDYVNDVEAGHTFPARGRGNACTALEAPFVGDCNYDAAGEILNYLYPELKAPGKEHETALAIITLAGAADAGMSDTAYLFVPPACVGTDQACPLHLVLHGCAQSAVTVGTDFIEQSGYLPWAEANNIVMAFPQVAPAALNPYACWDWWGYTGAEYRWRDGKQMTVITDWIQSL